MQVVADVLEKLPLDAVALVVPLEPIGVIVVVAFAWKVVVIVDEIDVVAKVVAAAVIVSVH